MEITYNNKKKWLEPGTTLMGLLQATDNHPEMVTVELNGRVLTREEFGGVVLKQGDEVKVLHFMGGGA